MRPSGINGKPCDRSLPLKWGPDMLTALARRMLKNLSPDMREDVIAFFTKEDVSQWNWSSACSGSESPHWAYEALLLVLAEEGVIGQFKHVFSAELELEESVDMFSCEPPLHVWRHVRRHTPSRKCIGVDS